MESTEERLARLEASLKRLEQRLDLLTASPLAASADSVPTADPSGRADSTAPPVPPSAGINAPTGQPPVVPTKWTVLPDDVDLEGLIAGRWLNRVGIVAVAIGISYFLKLAIDNDWIGPATQVAMGVVVGVSLLASVRWWARQGSIYFAEGIAALGAATLFLALWASGNYYALLPLGVVFAAMTMVTAAVMWTAVSMNSPRMAMLSLIGGFATPALVSTGQNAEVMLFSYLALLNISLLALARWRDWPTLAVPALFFTELYFWTWFSNHYTVPQRAVTFLFASVFFLVFLTLAVIRARRVRSMSWSHVALVPLNAAAMVAASAAMLATNERWLLTLTTLGASGLHSAAASLVPDEDSRPDARVVLGGVALVLATLAIPIQLDGPWVTVGWSVEAAVLMWSSFTLQRSAMRGLAYLLFAVVALQILQSPFSEYRFITPIFNSRVMAEATAIACMVIGWVTARRWRATFDSLERTVHDGLAVAANALTLMMLTEQTRIILRRTASAEDFFGPGFAEELAISMLWATYAVVLMMFGIRRRIPGLRWQALALLGLTTLKVFVQDLSFLTGAYRVASSIALGIALLGISFVYQRSRRRAGLQ